MDTAEDHRHEAVQRGGSSRGDETELADMYGACEALIADMKIQLGFLKAVHHLNFDKKRRDPIALTAEQVRKAPPVEHDMIRIHPETGRPKIYLGDMDESIVGMDYHQGRILIE